MLDDDPEYREAPQYFGEMEASVQTVAGRDTLRSHPIEPGVDGRCTVCKLHLSAQRHLSDFRVDLRRVVVGAVVRLDDSGRCVGGTVAAEVVRMDSPTFGVVEVRPEHQQGDPYRAVFSALNVVGVAGPEQLKRGEWVKEVDRCGTPEVLIVDDPLPRDEAYVPSPSFRAAAERYATQMREAGKVVTVTEHSPGHVTISGRDMEAVCGDSPEEHEPE